MNSNQYNLVIEMIIVGIIALVSSIISLVLMKKCFDESLKLDYNKSYESIIRFLFVNLLFIIVMSAIFEVIWVIMYPSV